MTIPDTNSLEALDAPTVNLQIRGAIATISVGAFMTLLALTFHGLAAVAGLGGAFVALGIRSLVRTRRFPLWWVSLIVFGVFAVAALVTLLVLVAIGLIRSRH